MRWTTVWRAPRGEFIARESKRWPRAIPHRLAVTTKYLLALDAGSGSGRSVLVSTDGRECYSASTDWGYQYEPDAGDMACHFDPDLFWSVLSSTVRDVLAKAGADGRQVIDFHPRSGA